MPQRRQRKPSNSLVCVECGIKRLQAFNRLQRAQRLARLQLQAYRQAKSRPPKPPPAPPVPKRRGRPPRQQPGSDNLMEALRMATGPPQRPQQ